ncbi:MAG: tripartite tricarboxylate transporter substrate-binding protein [Burkholderiales bacterium]
MTTAVVAQTYPSRPIHLIVPYPPGQSIDIMGRLIADKLSVALGQPVIVENKAGAGGVIGVDAGAKAAPDGYTLIMISNGTLVIAPWLVEKIPFDPVKDVTPIANAASVAHVLVAAPDFPANNLAEFVAWAKAKPGGYYYASPGSGSTQHLTMEMLKTRTGINIVHVPYKASPQAQTDIVGGHVPVMFDSVPALMTQLSAGKLNQPLQACKT